MPFDAASPDRGRPQPSSRLHDAVVLLYGAGSDGETPNVGQATAYAYACAGARLVLVDRDRARAQITANQLARIGCRPEIVQADITIPAQVAAATATALEVFGRLDVLHNNVGGPLNKAFVDFTPEDWRAGFDLNCLGAATAMAQALPHLVRSKGAIVNVSSVASLRYTGMTYAVYSAAKAALNQLTVCAALEYAKDGVRANVIVPGLLDTGMGRALQKPGEVGRAERSPTGFEGNPWDVANASVYLASGEARYVNGHMLVVDGGLSARC